MCESRHHIVYRSDFDTDKCSRGIQQKCETIALLPNRNAGEQLVQSSHSSHQDLGFGRHLIGLFRSHVDPKAKLEAGHSFRMPFRSLIEGFQQSFVALFRELRLSLEARLQSGPNSFGESQDRATSQELLAADCCSELFSEVSITDERQ
jgi:hypothetical protein